MAYRARFRDALDSAEGGPFDVILCPAFPLPAMRHGATDEVVLAGAYSCLYNVLGYPAGVVPITRVRAERTSPLRPLGTRWMSRLTGLRREASSFPSECQSAPT